MHVYVAFREVLFIVRMVFFSSLLGAYTFEISGGGGITNHIALNMERFVKFPSLVHMCLFGSGVRVLIVGDPYLTREQAQSSIRKNVPVY